MRADLTPANHVQPVPAVLSDLHDSDHNRGAPTDYTLRRRGAISPETAQSVDDMSASHRRSLQRYVTQGLIREASHGRYYHDAAAERESTRKQLPIIVGLVILLLGVGIATGWWASHNGGARQQAVE